jgi:2-dehydro-3-deoxyphosphogalactonate aldolase
VIGVGTVLTARQVEDVAQAGGSLVLSPDMNPADVLGAATLKAWRSVMPTDVRVVAVGGIDAGNVASFLSAGAAGAGVGSWLYKPEATVEQVKQAALKLVESTA